MTDAGVQIRCQRCGEQMELRDPAPGQPWPPMQFWVCNRCGRHFWTSYASQPGVAKPAPAKPASAQGSGAPGPATPGATALTALGAEAPGAKATKGPAAAAGAAEATPAAADSKPA